MIDRKAVILITEEIPGNNPLEITLGERYESLIEYETTH